MSIVVALLLAIVIGVLAWIVYVVTGALRSITAEVSKVIGRVTANDPLQTVDDDGVIRYDVRQYLASLGFDDDAVEAFASQVHPDHPQPLGPAYVDPTDIDLPDPAEFDASNRVIMGNDPTWPVIEP